MRDELISHGLPTNSLRVTGISPIPDSSQANRPFGHLFMGRDASAREGHLLDMRNAVYDPVLQQTVFFSPTLSLSSDGGGTPPPPHTEVPTTHIYSTNVSKDGSMDTYMDREDDVDYDSCPC